MRRYCTSVLVKLPAEADRDTRAALLATVTRWAGDVPVESSDLSDDFVTVSLHRVSAGRESYVSHALPVGAPQYYVDMILHQCDAQLRALERPTQKRA